MPATAWAEPERSEQGGIQATPSTLQQSFIDRDAAVMPRERAGDVDGMAALYEPDAVLHIGGRQMACGGTDRPAPICCPANSIAMSAVFLVRTFVGLCTAAIALRPATVRDQDKA
jgi:hypothetical protein